MKRSASSLAKASLLLALALLAGCDLFDSGAKAPDGASGLDSPWIGRPLDSLKAAKSVALQGGRLYVTNRDSLRPGTAVVDTATGAIVEYYPQRLHPSGLAFTASGKVVVTEGTWGQPGGVSVIDPVARRIRQSVLAFDQDNAVAGAGGRVYLIDRTAGVVTGFTGDEPGKNVTLDAQTGAGSNPYDIAVLDGKAYIPRYNLASLLILGDVDALDGGARDSVDLSAYAHAGGGGIPFMSGVTAYGGRVFVTLERWKADYSEQDSGMVVVIDAATKAVEKVLTLPFRNPGSGTVRDGIWYLPAMGAYGVRDGGVVKIDLAARTVAGVAITEEEIGGDVGSLAITGEDAGYVAWSPDFFYTTRVKKFGP